MKLSTLSLKQIKRTENSRPDDFDYSELMLSIKKSGLIQPVVVAKNFYSKTGLPYVLVAGNRRLRACERLGMATVPAVINERVKNEADLLIFNMSENLQRRDVSAFEQGRLVDKLVAKHKLTEAECAVRLGIKLDTVRAMRGTFQAIPAKYRDKIVIKKLGRKSGTISLGTAKRIANTRKSGWINAKQASDLLGAVVDHKYSDKHIENICKQVTEGAAYDTVKRVTNRINYIAVKIPVYNSEINEIDGTTLDYLAQLIYGESNGHFTRPRFK